MQVPAEEEKKLQQLLQTQQQAGQQTLYHLPHMNLWTKLRPGVHVRTPLVKVSEVVADLPAHTLVSEEACTFMPSRMRQSKHMASSLQDCAKAEQCRRLLPQDFLSRTQQLYEMHIYTHGNAEYAVEMAKLLDPTKRLFAERIISQVACVLPQIFLQYYRVNAGYLM